MGDLGADRQNAIKCKALVQYNALIALLNAAICSPVTLLFPIVIRPLTEVCQEIVH